MSRRKTHDLDAPALLLDLSIMQTNLLEMAKSIHEGKTPKLCSWRRCGCCQTCAPQAAAPSPPLGEEDESLIAKCIRSVIG